MYLGVMMTIPEPLLCDPSILASSYGARGYCIAFVDGGSGVTTRFHCMREIKSTIWYGRYIHVSLVFSYTPSRMRKDVL